jgi:enoyl-CoA hydratase/carnithine racemase
MEQDDGRISLILDRPERKNAFDIPTTLALADALTEVAADRSARVFVIKGAGGVFSAGRDLKAEAGTEPTPDEAYAKDQAWVRSFHILHNLEIPSVAVVNGYAVAGGFTLSMILARLVGPRLGLELAMFGDLVEATRLYEMGLINQLADDANTLEAVEADFVGRLMALDSRAVALTRETFRAAENMPLDNALDMGKHLNQYLTASGWFTKGAKKFLDGQKN